MQAAERLRITAQEHYRLKIADGIIPVSTLVLQHVSHCLIVFLIGPEYYNNWPENGSYKIPSSFVFCYY